MKAILTDYSRWSSAKKLAYMESVPEVFFRIKNKDGSEMCDSSFSIYDISDLDGISAGDGETIVSIRGRKNSIYCDGVVFLEDGDDIKERYIELLKKDGYNFEIVDIEEVDMNAKREELEKRSLSVKEKIKSVATDMLKSGSIVPGEMTSDSESFFKDRDEELLSLGYFIYSGIPGIHGYLYSKLGIDPDSVRMFNIVNYEYPLVVVCLRGNLEKADGCPAIMRKIEDCMNMVSCYRLPKDYSYTDIDFFWKDTEFYEEKHDAYFIICHYRPCADEVETGRKCIELGIEEGLSLEKIGEDVEIDLPGSIKFRTTAGVEFLKMMCEWLNEKVVIEDNSALWEALIEKFSKELFSRVGNYKSFSSSDKFIYKRMLRS